MPWGPEWYEASKKSTDFLLATESLNRTHPGYYRALPEDVQMACVRRILGCLTTRNPFLDRNIRWRRSTMCVVHCRLTGKCCTMLYNVGSNSRFGCADCNTGCLILATPKFAYVSESRNPNWSPQKNGRVQDLPPPKNGRVLKSGEFRGSKSWILPFF